MKRLAAILLVMAYVLSYTGVSISKFYCCGKLKSVHLVYSHPQQDLKTCQSIQKSAGCCQHQWKHFQLTDSHSGSSIIHLAPGNFPLLAVISDENIGAIGISHFQRLNGIHSPPGENVQIPLFILYQSFRA